MKKLTGKSAAVATCICAMVFLCLGGGLIYGLNTEEEETVPHLTLCMVVGLAGVMTALDICMIRLSKVCYEAEYAKKTAQVQKEANEKLEQVNAALAKAARQADELRKQAEQANNAKSRFLSSVSHDVRTPLNAIIGLSELIGQTWDDPEAVKRYASRLNIVSKHLMGVIDDVLDIQKIELGKENICIEATDLSALLNNLEKMIAPDIKRKKQHFILDTNRMILRRAMTDGNKISQILLNLLMNAVKYTQEGGEIRLSAVGKPEKRLGDVEMRFTVEDNGQGMDEAYLDRLFEPFSKEGRNDTGEGTGLGMAVCKRLVTMLNGNIQVTSELNKGTRVDVTLTLKAAKMDEGLASDGDKPLQGIRILMAEDSEINAEIIMEQLIACGAECVRAADGRQAVQCYEQDGRFDVILMDVQMPIMSGLDAAKAIREKDGTQTYVPIIAMTANTWSDIWQKVRDAGMDAYISKPIERDALVKTILNTAKRKISA